MTAAHREVVAHSHPLEQNTSIVFILALSMYIFMWLQIYGMFATTNHEFNCLLKLYFRGLICYVNDTSVHLLIEINDCWFLLNSM